MITKRRTDYHIVEFVWIRTFNNKTPKKFQRRRLTSLWCLYCQLRTYFIVSILMLCCNEIFFYGLVFNESMFSWLCSQTRLIKKQKEINVKYAYLNRGSGEVAGLPGFHSFSGADTMGSYLSDRKKKCW